MPIDEKQESNKEVIKTYVDKNYLPNFGKLEMFFQNNKLLYISRVDTERIEK
jgi:hypothetical protein